MFDNLKADTRRMKILKSKAFPWYVLESLLLDNGYQAVVLYRMSHWFKKHRIPFVGPFLQRLNIFLTGVDISPSAEIGPGLLISHGVGLVVGGHVKIGANALLLHGVTLGSPSRGKVEKMPRVGDNAFLGAGAKLIGDIEIGDDVMIGPNAVVMQDIPAGSKVLTTAGIEITQS